MISARVRVLIEFKKNAERGISKRAVAEKVGVDPNSVQAWRTLYQKGGIEAILKHGRKGGRLSHISADEHKRIEQKLNDPRNDLRGYVELLDWVKTELGNPLKYDTLLKYCTRHFGSKVKVARKNHVKKDVEAVETFKKTSAGSVSKPQKSNRGNTRA